jgi:sulfur-oxidizing protein SoxX
VRRRLGSLGSIALALAFWVGTGAQVSAQPGTLPEPHIVGDRVPGSLTGGLGDAQNGRRIVLDRETGNCLICHRAPEPAQRFQGDIGPSLAGVGSRLDAGQIRLRIIDQSRINPATVMPPYYRTGGLRRVAARFVGRPVLTAAEVEDVVAYLTTLKE